MIKKIILWTDAICLLLLCLVGIGYSIHVLNTKVDNQKSVILSDIINVTTEDRKIEFNGIKASEPYEKEFKLENISDKKTNFNLYLKNIDSEFNNELFYEIYEKDTLIVSKSLAANEGDENYLKLDIELLPADKKEYKIKYFVNEDSDKKYSAELAINSLKINTKINTATNYILLNTPVIDNENKIYYYTNGNNYVSFNDELWRIVKINSNGSIKIVKDTSIDEKVLFNEDAKSDGANDYKNSNIKLLLQKYYDESLKKYENMLVQDKYCNDINIVKNENYKTNDNDKTTTEYISTLECNGSKSYIGTISYDEVDRTFIGEGKYINTWTLSKAGVNSRTSENYVWYINNRGHIDYTKTDNDTLYVRPTITLKGTLNIKGSGDINDPYVFME